MFLSSCGTPGDPTPPRPVVPVAVSDLAARQQGEAVVLTFTLPTKSTEGEVLPEIPIVEIFRRASGASAPRSGTDSPLYTVPAALVDTYLVDGRFRFSDPLTAEAFAGAGAASLEYRIRTRVTSRRASADSNAVTVSVYPPPEKITGVEASVTQEGIELRWTAPTRTAMGSAIPSLGAYRVYRAEVPAEAGAAVPPAVLVGVAPSASHRDTQFEFGRTYIYTVRSVAQYDADTVESADSEPVRVTPRDVFPPSPPRDVVFVAVPATADVPAQIDLSWAINTETDLAGYHVYRSEREAARGERVHPELLLVPTFRDMSVAPGRRYTYRITAIDRNGNESAASAPVTAALPAPEKP